MMAGLGEPMIDAARAAAVHPASDGRQGSQP